AGRDAAEDPLAPREVARARDRPLVGDRDHLVEDVAIENRGDEVGRPPLDLVRLPLLSIEERGACRLARDDPRPRARAFDYLPRAGERATRAPPGDPIVETLAREVREDLRPGGLAVVGRVRLVVELAREEPAALLCELRGEADRSRRALRRRREDD